MRERSRGLKEKKKRECNNKEQVRKGESQSGPVWNAGYEHGLA